MNDSIHININVNINVNVRVFEKKKVRQGCFCVIARNLAPSPFVAQACSGATKLAADPSIHLLHATFFVWLDRVESSRNSMKTINFS